MSYISILKSADPEFFKLLDRVDRGYVNRKGKPSPCLEFTGGKFSNGYGRVYRASTGEIKAHRHSYVLAKGKIGKRRGKSLLVLHKCDNRACCHPAHLYASDHRRNMDDMVERNRQARGESNARATKTERDVAFIKLMRSMHFSYQVIADIMGCSKGTIGKFGPTSKAWSHVDAMPATADILNKYLRFRYKAGKSLHSVFVSTSGTSSPVRRFDAGFVRQTVEVFGQINAAAHFKSSRKKIRGLLEHADSTVLEWRSDTGDFRTFVDNGQLNPTEVLQLIRESKYVR